MAAICFFCDVEKNIILESTNFFVHLSNFPVSPGHCEIAPKKHHASFFDLSEQEVIEIYQLIKQTQKLIIDLHHPDGFNVGLNEGEAAGQSIKHLHVHLIPRYNGDVENPKGGVRNVIPNKADYTKNIDPALKKYL